jgi:hypothetical protein
LKVRLSAYDWLRYLSGVRFVLRSGATLNYGRKPFAFIKQ